MPIYQHGDFYREVADLPPELEPLRAYGISGYSGRPDCCDECRLYYSFTQERRDTARGIIALQVQAQRDLDAYRDRQERCGWCQDRMPTGRTATETAEGSLILCQWCETRTVACDRCERACICAYGLHGDLRYCRSCAERAAGCWCGLLYDPDDGDECPQPRGQIHSYSYRPEPVFHTVGDGTDRRLKVKQGVERDLTPYMGFELEVSFAYSNASREDAAGTVSDIIGEVAYLKEDGSISDGFELVTHPMTLEYAIHRFPWRVLAAMDSAGGEVNDDLGLHIHVSKAAFDSPSHEYRWLLFWHRNYRIMRKLARRDSHEWAAWSPDARAAAKRIAKKESRGQEFGRYQAINTTNEATHEVRIFGATLVPEEIIADLALVSGTVEYCRELDANGVLKASGWEFDTFAAWAAKRPVYASLSADIAQHFPHGFAAVPKSPGRRPRNAPRRPIRPPYAATDAQDAFDSPSAAMSNWTEYQEESN